LLTCGPIVNRPLLFIALALSLGAQSAKEWYALGGQYGAKANQSFEELLKLAPESGYVLALLGETKTKDLQFTAALYAYHEAIKRQPSLRGIHSAMSGVYSAINRPEQSKRAEEEEQKRPAPDCAIEKQYCAFQQGRFEDLIKLATPRKTPENLYWQVRAYNELSIKALSQLQNFPDSAEMHEIKAGILTEQRKFKDAADEWREVAKLEPAHPAARQELASALYMSGDFKAVLPELTGLLEADPGSPELNFFVGDCLLQTEQVEQSLPYLETAIKKQPRLLPAHASLGFAYARLGSPAKAIPQLKMALPLDQDGSLHYQLSKAYQATGQSALARVMMAKYQTLHDKSTAKTPVQ
jgi:predicted Zn-dependent protease